MKKMGVVILLLLCTSPSWALTVGGYTFEDYAFATKLKSYNGNFSTTDGYSLSDALTDKNEVTYATLAPPKVSEAYVVLEFNSCNIVNGPDADIVLFELAGLSMFKLKLNDVDKVYTTKYMKTVYTEYYSTGIDLNAVAIDLSDFGIASGALLNSLWIGMDIGGPGNLLPSLTLAGALNCVHLPVPPSGWLFAPVLGVLMGIKRRFLP
jgi:hypothetical protein